MAKKILILGMALIMYIGIFSGCGNKLPYNAVMYGEIYTNRTWLKDEFYEENLTSGSWSDLHEEYVSDEEYPPTRTIIIANSAEYNEVFKSFPVDVNFDNTMIIMHCFTTSSGSSYEIKSISVDEQLLTINYRHITSKKSAPNASKPLTKWVIVMMDKLDIETVEFVYGK